MLWTLAEMKGEALEKLCIQQFRANQSSLKISKASQRAREQLGQTYPQPHRHSPTLHELQIFLHKNVRITKIIFCWPVFVYCNFIGPNNSFRNKLGCSLGSCDSTKQGENCCKLCKIRWNFVVNSLQFVSGKQFLS